MNMNLCPICKGAGHGAPTCPQELATIQTINELATQLYAYATEHYEDGGWDVIVECFDHAEIAAQLAEDGATDLKSAIESFSTQVDVWSERQADARNSAF